MYSDYRTTEASIKHVFGSSREDMTMTAVHGEDSKSKGGGNGGGSGGGGGGGGNGGGSK